MREGLCTRFAAGHVAVALSNYVIVPICAENVSWQFPGRKKTQINENRLQLQEEATVPSEANIKFLKRTEISFLPVCCLNFISSNKFEYLIIDYGYTDFFIDKNMDDLVFTLIW